MEKKIRCGHATLKKTFYFFNINVIILIQNMSTRLQKRKRDEEEDKAEALRETQALEKALHSPVQNAELREQNAILQLQVRVLQEQVGVLQEQVGVLQEQIDTGAIRLTGRALLQASLQAGLSNAQNVERIRKRFKGNLTAGTLSFNGHQDNPYNILVCETDKCLFCTRCWSHDGTIRIFLSSQVVASIH